jgi:hypothetical protein
VTLSFENEFYENTIEAMTWDSISGGYLILLSVDGWQDDNPFKKAWMLETAPGLLKPMYQVGDLIGLAIYIKDDDYYNETDERTISCEITEVEVDLSASTYDVIYTIEGMKLGKVREDTIAGLSYEDERLRWARWEASGQRSLGMKNPYPRG